MGRMKRQTTGKAGNYIVHFENLLLSRHSLKVVLYCRVSRCWQSENGNLKSQNVYLEKTIQRYRKKNDCNIHITTTFKEVASGWEDDRTRLIDAARTAKACNAVLVAESTCRFLRSARFHSNKKPGVLPTIYEYESLVNDTQGVTLATIMPPDTAWKDIKGFQAKRGQRSRNSHGGRPRDKYPGYKNDRRTKYLKQVLQYDQKGLSIADIVRKTNIPRSTISDWIKTA